MDQGKICNIKTHYRKRILTNISSQMEEKKCPTPIKLLDAIRNLSQVANINATFEGHINVDCDVITTDKPSDENILESVQESLWALAI